MPRFRRLFIPGGTYFFTLTTDRRIPFLCEEAARSLLSSLFRQCRGRWPFSVPAIVLLPDHLHTIWTLPEGDAAYPKRWGWMKKEFTKEWMRRGHPEQVVSVGRRRDRRRGVWQPRFWEHTVRDEEDLERLFDYIHYNPVKHGLVWSPFEWPWSSFHRWVRQGVYPPNWACGDSSPPDLDEIANITGEPEELFSDADAAEHSGPALVVSPGRRPAPLNEVR